VFGLSATLAVVSERPPVASTLDDVVPLVTHEQDPRSVLDVSIVGDVDHDFVAELALANPGVKHGHEVVELEPFVGREPESDADAMSLHDARPHSAAGAVTCPMRSSHA